MSYADTKKLTGKQHFYKTIIALRNKNHPYIINNILHFKVFILYL